MICESECTIYTRNSDGTYLRQTTNCHWEDQRGISFNRTGVRDVDSVFVMIPIESVKLPVLSEKGKKQNYILRGETTEEVASENLAEFLLTHDVLTITAIEKNDYSLGLAQNHWAVYAK